MTAISKAMKFWASAALACAALLPFGAAQAQSAQSAQTSPVHKLTRPFITLAFDVTTQLYSAVNGELTFESQRVVDPVEGDALVINILFSVPVVSQATKSVYRIDVRETVIKPFAGSVPVEITLPMDWQSGGSNPSPRSAVVNWNLFTAPDGSVTKVWLNSMRVIN